jgi:flavin-dependent dehydrogenase
LELLNRGYSTVVIERSDYRGARIGETLPPAIQPLLVRLGIWDRFLAGKHAPSFSIRAAWGGDDLHENDLIFNPYGAGWHVDRTRFDAMLARCAEDAGATVYLDASPVTCENGTSGNWKIKITHGDQRRSLSTRFLVDATGRAAFAARKQGARRLTLDHLIGVVYFSSQKSALDSSTLIEATENGWWYSAALPDSRLVLAYMTDADLYARERKRSSNYFLRQLESTKHSRSRVGSKDFIGDFRIVAANSSRLNFVAGRNWLAVGDAAMAFDPLSGQGVYKALEFGLLASRSIQQHLAGDTSALQDYSSAVEKDFNSYLLTRKQFYARETRFPDSLFWQRRQLDQTSVRHAQ